MESSHYQQLKQILSKDPHTWLITGVAGFIGSNLLEELLKLNQIVIGIDNFSTGSKHNLKNVLDAVTKEQQQKFYFYDGDICSREDCKKVIKNVDYVLHQAALGSVPRSITTPDMTHASNVNGFLNMLLAAKEAKVKRFVYASSSSVYGDSPDLPKKEEKIGSPLSPYAVSKYTNELYAHAFSTCYAIQAIGLRYFNVFGPRQDPNGPYAAVIPRWIKALLANESVFIHGDGETSRDFCYVENVVQANLLAALTQNIKAINHVYNIAVGEQNSLKKLYELIVKFLNLSINEKIVYRDFRPGDIRHSLADVSKAKVLLGYNPIYKLNEGLPILIKWYQNQS